MCTVVLCAEEEATLHSANQRRVPSFVMIGNNFVQPLQLVIFQGSSSKYIILLYINFLAFCGIQLMLVDIEEQQISV